MATDKQLGVAPFGVEIHVEGVVEESLLAGLGDFVVYIVPATTILTGRAADQAALLGLITSLRARGPVIPELNRRVTGELGLPHR